MPRVSFPPLTLAVEAAAGSTLLDAARLAGAPVGSACGDIGVCGRCRVRVVEGASALSVMTRMEEATAASRSFASDERLACQAVLWGEVAFTTSYW